MRERFRSGIMIPVFVALAALICVAVLLSPSSEPAPTETYTPITLDQYSSTVISRSGLSLTLSLNSTTYHPGQQIPITINEKNILLIENKIHAANRWPVQGLSLTPCGTLSYPFGISMLKGYYDAKDAVAISPLQLFDPNGYYACPAMLAPVSYDFQPWSDVVAIYTSYDHFTPLSINMTATVTSAGFWTVTHGHPTWTFSNFTPGIYTVVGGDEWGALVVLHFAIS